MYLTDDRLPGEARQFADTPRSVVHVIDLDDAARGQICGLLTGGGLRPWAHSSLQAFRAAAHPDGAGCVVIDAGLCAASGLDLHDLSRPSGIPYPVIVTAFQADVTMAVRAIKTGATDFLARPFRDQDMLTAVVRAIQADRDRRGALGRQAEMRARFAKLTVRERQVMVLVAAGKMNKQVAGSLGLSEITIKAHRGAAMRKMGARSLADLVRMADALEAPPRRWNFEAMLDGAF